MWHALASPEVLYRFCANAQSAACNWLDSPEPRLCLGPASDAVQSIMTLTLGVALLLTAAAMFYKAARGR